MDLRKKRVMSLPPTVQEDYKRRRSAKELRFGIMPGATDSGPKRRKNESPVLPAAGPSPTVTILTSVPSPSKIKKEYGGDGSDIDEGDKDLDLDYTVVSPKPITAHCPDVYPDTNQSRLLNVISEMDAEDDSAMQHILPPECLIFNWKSDISGFNGVRETFTGTPGPTFPISEMGSPVDVFLKIWDPAFTTTIVNETNQYAKCLQVQLKVDSRMTRWTPTNINEIYILFAVMMYQSLYPLAVERDYYYAADRMTAMPFFKEVLPYNRLVLLKKCLHFANNDEMGEDLSLERKRLYKIQPVIDHLNEKFQTLYLPGQNIAIDESLLKWNGHLTFIQKIATKTAKAGIKSYELCESDTGYLWKFIVYAGKGAADPLDNKPSVKDSQPSGATVKIVYDLASPLFFKGHTLIMDNFYNSPLLARSLKLKNTDCFGTLRLHRENVPESLKSLSKTQLKTGDLISSTSGDLNVMVWKDTNIVGMITTYHKVEIGATKKYGRWQHKPQVVLDYNTNMGGVDKKDQLLSSFSLERKRNSVWYKKVFRRLMNVSIQNAYIIYKHKEKKITQRQFRLQLARGLIEKCTVHPTRVVSNTLTTSRILPGTQPLIKSIMNENHFLVKIAEIPFCRQCVWCKSVKKRGRTIRECDKCKVPLCVDCMKPYHTECAKELTVGVKL